MLLSKKHTQHVLITTVLAILLTLFIPLKADALGGSVVSRTNEHRAAVSLPSYSTNGLLQASAQVKAQDICARSYWDHIAPDGTTPWDLMRENGYQYSKAGENLAKGFETDAGVVNGWMNSPPHRANVLHESFSEIGIGVATCENGEHVVVAHYASPKTKRDTSTPPSTTRSSESGSMPSTRTTTTENGSAPILSSRYCPSAIPPIRTKRRSQ